MKIKLKIEWANGDTEIINYIPYNATVEECLVHWKDWVISIHDEDENFKYALSMQNARRIEVLK